MSSILVTGRTLFGNTRDTWGSVCL